MRLRKLLTRSFVAAALLGSGLTVTAEVPAVAATGLPAGFSVQTISTPLDAVGAYKLTDIEYVPPAAGVEPGIFAAGKDGSIAWIPDNGTSRILGKVPNVRQKDDNGMVGLTPAHDYAKSRRIYMVYNRTGTTHHYGMLSAWRVDNVAHPTSATWEKHVIDGSLGSWIDDGPNHQVGDVVAAPDGSLFVSQGDGLAPTPPDPKAMWAQDTNDPHGKILHLLPDGKGAPDNPYYDSANPSSWKSRVYATGVRNGFRLWRDAGSGRLLTSIVGLDSRELIAQATKGANFGWPCWEGELKTPGFSSLSQCQQMYATKPAPSPAIYSYAHNGVQASVTGGVTYTGSTYPAQYRNKTFFGDFARKELWTLGTDGQKLTSGAVKFAGDVGNVTSVRTCQNGDICWTDIVSNRIMRLRYGLANRVPVADFSTSTDSSTRTVSFDGSASYDPEGDQLRYAWEFGDGTTGAGATVTHQYASGGPFTAKLTVFDGLNNSGDTSLEVFPSNAPPTITLTKPEQGDFAVGDTVTLSASVKDREDGTLPASAINWKVEMQHCPFNGGCHPHPSGSGTGSNFSAVFPDHGGDTRLVFTATSPADSSGATSKVVFVAEPRLHEIKVNVPSGVTATINSDVTNSVRVVAKAAITVSVPASSSAGPFQKWSDGVTTTTRQMTMPDVDLTLTAIYGTATNSAIDQKYQAMGGSKSWLGEPTGNEFAVGSGRQRNYKWGSLYWSPSTDVHFVKGAIRNKYNELGGAAKFGFPTTDEVKSADGVTAYNSFKGDKGIYWTADAGAHEVHGGIYKAWVATGAERGRLGYPISDEYKTSAGPRSDFKRGYIVWDNKTGKAKITYK